jgi:hypothetical protein
MGTDVDGYVEISTIELSDEDLWFEVLNINIIAERNYSIFGKLFGVRASENVVPIALNRGVPENTSNPENLGVNIEHQFGYSWLTWNEIEKIVSTIATIDEAPGWTLIFSTMQSLASIYGSKNVRLVVSFF